MSAAQYNIIQVHVQMLLCIVNMASHQSLDHCQSLLTSPAKGLDVISPYRKKLLHEQSSNSAVC